MATPQFNFLLPEEQAENLRAVAKIYGTNTSAFLREMIGAICGGTPEGPAPFLQKLGMALGQQRQLQLFAEMAKQGAPKAKVGRKRPKRAKGRTPK